MNETKPRLKLKSIDASYGPVQVLFDLNIEVREGEIVCLLGGNASGKSTTMKIILGLLRPKAGEILWEGEAAQDLDTSERIRRGIAAVPESRRIFPDMTVKENLLMGAYARKDRRSIGADLEEVLELFPKLAERLRQAGGTLSGGEQQMLALARALMSKPRLVCMDEPTMGLSPLWVDRVLDLVETLNKRGLSFFMVEQNAHLALSLAHRGYVLQNGYLVLEGQARDLLEDPRIRDAYLGGDQMAGI